MRTFRTAAVAALIFALALPVASHAKTVNCADGTTSKAGRGACSHHGGVAGATTTPPNAKETPPPAKEKPPAAKETPPPAHTKATKPASPVAAKSGTEKEEDTSAAGATAECKDGTYSHAAHHSGACSKHGGVARWMK